MSNIHRIGDFENDNNRNQRGRVPFLNNNRANQDPRKEHFGSFLKNFCCPTFTVKSFIFIIAIVDVIMFIITLVHGGVGKQGFLQVNPNTLKKFGSLV